ncbi:hypothetical protein WA158_000358 [Blastocystis sp. Blastoise]
MFGRLFGKKPAPEPEKKQLDPVEAQIKSNETIQTINNAISGIEAKIDAVQKKMDEAQDKAKEAVISKNTDLAKKFLEDKKRLAAQMDGLRKQVIALEGNKALVSSAIDSQTLQNIQILVADTIKQIAVDPDQVSDALDDINDFKLKQQEIQMTLDQFYASPDAEADEEIDKELAELQQEVAIEQTAAAPSVNTTVPQKQLSPEEELNNMQKAEEDELSRLAAELGM